MMMAREQAAREAKLKADLQAETAAQHAELAMAAAKLQDALLKAKREQRTAGPSSGGRGGRRGHKRVPTKKKGFGDRPVANTGNPESNAPAVAEIELVVATKRTQAQEEKQEKTGKKQQQQQKKKKKGLKGRQHKSRTASGGGGGAASSMGEPDRPESVGDYEAMVDHSTGRTYYVHRHTRVSSWILPNDDDAAVTIDGANPAFNTTRPTAPSSVQRQRSFRRHRTADDREYFEEVGTGLTVWSLPEDSIVL